MTVSLSLQTAACRVNAFIYSVLSSWPSEKYVIYLNETAALIVLYYYFVWKKICIYDL